MAIQRDDDGVTLGSLSYYMVDCDFERYFDYLSQNEILSYILHHCQWAASGSLLAITQHPQGVRSPTPTALLTISGMCSAKTALKGVLQITEMEGKKK